MSRFIYSPQIKRIPEGLFKECTNVEKFVFTFADCSQITEIPEKLFENNTKVWSFHRSFLEYRNNQNTRKLIQE